MDRAALMAAMAAAQPKPVAVHVPAWGGTVYVKALTLAEAEGLGESTGKHNLARGLAAVVVDKAGVRVFDPNSADDIALIESQGMSNVTALLEAVNGVNAATEAAIETLGKVSTPAKN